LVGRLVLRPVQGLMTAADAVAAGDLNARAPGAETEEFDRLAERLNAMTEALLDVQSQLVRAEKLASIGRLAAGVAHEIGNPLAALGTYLEVLRQRGAVEPELVEDLSREVDRIDRIVRGLLDYARPDASAQRIETAAALRAVLALLSRQGRLPQPPATVEIDEPLPAIRGPADALERVVLNLVLNALDADPTGRVTIRAVWSSLPSRGNPARRRGDDAHPAGTLERRPAARRPSRPDLPVGAPGILLVVSDRGPGVKATDRERIFDPFFTTKPPGAGIGLGLALVQRAVDDMSGIVWVEDAREGGAAFKVFLPAAGEGEGAVRAVRAEGAEPAGPPARRPDEAQEERLP
jgi:signal transduction histidine kinase